LQVGPKGVEFAKYSVDYHFIRNYLAVQRAWGPKRAERQIPEFAKRIVAEYDDKQQVSKRIPMRPKQ
jgi:7-hydroxymethyl chlorophyll a reductase